MRHAKHKQHQGHKKNPTDDGRGDQNRRGRNRSDLVAAQHVRLALLHGAHARTEQSVAQHADNDHHGDDLSHGVAAVPMQSLGEDHEKNQRKHVIEEQHGLLPQRELEVQLDECDVTFHFFKLSS